MKMEFNLIFIKYPIRILSN